MINQLKPRGKYFSQFKKLVRRKTGPARAVLNVISPDVQKRYKEYRLREANLEVIAKRHWLPVQVSALKSCYTNSDRFQTDLLKSRGIRTNGSVPDPMCPYCQVDYARTWDHFLQSEHFPEYYVFSPNLVRSCSDCNSRKKQALGTPRNFLNPFFDDLQTVRYLQCHVRRIGPDRRFVAKFFCGGDPAVLGYSQYLADIAARHFEKLDLAAKLTADAARQIGELMNDVQQWCLVITDANMRIAVQKRVAARRAIGASENDFTLVLFESLLSVPNLG